MKKLKITTGAEDSGIIPTWEDIKEGWNNNMLMGKDPGIIIKCTKSFFKGLVYDTGKSALEGIGNMVLHPVNTVKGIGNALAHPIDTVVNIKEAVSTAFNNEVVNGDASSRAHFAGRAVGEIALAVFGPKDADKVAKVAKGSKYAAEAANALNKIKNISVNSEKLSEAIGRLNNIVNKSDELVEASTGVRISNIVEEYGKVGIETLKKNETQLKYMEAVEDAAKGVSEAGDDFTGMLRKEKVELPGVKTKDINYVKREPEEAEKLRKAFNSTEKKKFLQNLTEDIEKLKRAGLSDSDIDRMKDGLNPKGWQVHHKLPLDDGGTNAMDNLILIKNEPYHKTITNFQNTFAKQLSPGETKIVKWPIPEGNIYPPNN